MKIRTNFVTNSSSYSSAEIKIDNPVLLEILKKYKEKGAFVCRDGRDRGWAIGMSELEAKENWRDPYDDEDEGEELDTTPKALYFYDQEMADVFFAPDSIEEIVKAILDVIVSDYEYELKNKQLFAECKQELEARSEEINGNYVEVSWEAANDSYGEDEPDEDDETSWEFYYKK